MSKIRTAHNFHNLPSSAYNKNGANNINNYNANHHHHLQHEVNEHQQRSQQHQQQQQHHQQQQLSMSTYPYQTMTSTPASSSSLSSSYNRQASAKSMQQPMQSAAAAGGAADAGRSSSLSHIGNEIRTLKLGSTMNPNGAATAFHTIKYDFKPKSVDPSRDATVEIGASNQVTVTVPNLASCDVPNTIYKGNHRDYTKECLLIFDKETGEFTIERLNSNFQVKKTRHDPSTLRPTNGLHAINGNGSNGATATQQHQQQQQHQSSMPSNSATITGATTMSSTASSTAAAAAAVMPKVENHTIRKSNKTKVSTGSRKNARIDYKPRTSPKQPISPSGMRPRSPNTAPAWNPLNGQSTLPSIPVIDAEFLTGTGYNYSTISAAATIPTPAITKMASNNLDVGGGGGGYTNNTLTAKQLKSLNAFGNTSSTSSVVGAGKTANKQKSGGTEKTAKRQKNNSCNSNTNAAADSGSNQRQRKQQKKEDLALKAQQQQQQQLQLQQTAALQLPQLNNFQNHNELMAANTATVTTTNDDMQMQQFLPWQQNIQHLKQQQQLQQQQQQQQQQQSMQNVYATQQQQPYKIDLMYNNQMNGSINNCAQNQQQTLEDYHNRTSINNPNVHSNNVHSNIVPNNNGIVPTTQVEALSDSSSDSGSDSESGSGSGSGSGSDSSNSDSCTDTDDSDNDEAARQQPQQQPQQQQLQQQELQAPQQAAARQHFGQLPNLMIGGTSPPTGVGMSQYNGGAAQQRNQLAAQPSTTYQNFLHNDLQLSSNSSDEDDN